VRLLNVGSGPIENEITEFPDVTEIVRLDINPDVEPDVVCDITKGMPFEEEFDLVYAFHVLEHLYRLDVMPAIKNLRNVLKDGGELWLAVPSWEWVCTQGLSESPSDVMLAVAFGSQETEYQLHKCAFTLNQLRGLTEAIGMIPRKATQMPFPILQGDQTYTVPQNVVIAMRHKEFERELDITDPSTALAE
jgi:predicted SAM-dependent methyltransferase